MEEVLFNSAALLEWPRAACKPDDPAQVRGWSCPSPTRPAAVPHCPEDTQLLGCRRALPCPLAAHRSGPPCSTLDLGGNCPGQTKALAAAGATKLQAGAPTQRQPAGSSVSHGVGGDRVGQERSSLGTLLLSRAQLLARYGQQKKASSSLQPSWQAWRSEEIRIAQGSLLSIDTPSNDLTGSPV